jgi:hypothetical protein
LFTLKSYNTYSLKEISLEGSVLWHVSLQMSCHFL